MCDCDPDYRCTQHDATQEMHDFLAGIENIYIITILLPAEVNP